MKSQSSETGGWQRPPSPSFSTTTTGSRVNLPAAYLLISRKDLRQSIACFEDLMAAAKAYRNALLAMSQATAAFAQAMEACSRVKGCRSANSALAGASGLQHLLANHDQLLADTVYRQFEIPLLSALDHYKLITADRLASYEQRLSEQSARIRKTEAENLRGGRRRKRDLDSFRLALAELQRQVDELDGIKAGYHEEVLEEEDEIWDTVLAKVAFVVRSQLDFYEKIAGKASDSILEPLVSSVPDPFDSYGPPKEEGQIFSVLAPLGMMDSIPQSPTPGFSRTRSSPSHSASASTSGNASPSRSAVFAPLTPVAVPARAETSTVSALGISSPDDGVGRARRELSVIDEREVALGEGSHVEVLDGEQDEREVGQGDGQPGDEAGSVLPDREEGVEEEGAEEADGGAQAAQVKRRPSQLQEGTVEENTSPGPEASSAAAGGVETDAAGERLGEEEDGVGGEQKIGSKEGS
ncbi:uncharacterized protein MKK02DRAFT_40858 [Dioszegia hungarica]|uniref:Uncharacterized protein n=1 Tax=Dioszegia hungarica TaxID=4972 RepID=A0AA38H1D3_9TREE|nr:uncharacterized protein MKK02DRAFT_40858 [Dioszegia hungarica]KAI9632553.1 hypothetical protein MKK02DRAFT_40858 [Dioszegia hungarica]